MNEQLVKFCDENQILVDEQNGFRKHRSCNDNLFSLTSIIRNRLATNMSTYCAFIDMEKAFDFVDRKLLYYCLLSYNVTGKMYRSIKALYRHTESCVRVNAMFSGWFFTNSGVRQGDSLSPTLFALFINRLAEEIKQLNKGVDVDGVNVSILLYADDIVLISGKETDLQHMLDYMKQWCFKWKLKLNVEKSKIVHFRRKNVTRTEFPFHFGENELEIIDRYKYLGIIIDEYLNYDVTAQMLSESAGRALGGIINKFKSLKGMGFRTFEKMYLTGVTSVAEYAADIWGFKDISACNTVQNRAMRYYMGVHRFAPIAGMRGDFGWSCTKYRRHQLNMGMPPACKVYMPYIFHAYTIN